MAISHDEIGVVAEWLNHCVSEYLDHIASTLEGYPGAPTHTCVVAGEPVAENCDCGGQLNTWLREIFPTTNFPQPDRDVKGIRGCKTPTMAANFLVSITRCAPRPNSRTNALPSCDELSKNAMLVHTDAQALFEALTCCLSSPAPGKRRPYQHLITRVVVENPSGGCVASTALVTIAIGTPCGCPDDSEPES